MNWRKYIHAIYKPSVMFLIIVSCFVTVTMDVWRSWHTNQSQVSWDVANYYSYLPAYFGNNGSFEFNNPGFENNYLPVYPGDNKHIPKTTYGMALMYSPLYALGYKIAINQNDPRDGFSEPFYTVLHWGTMAYALLGLLLLRNFLVKFFSEKVTTITLIVLFMGTTLFFYSVSMPEMPHSNLFFLFAAFLLVNYHWHHKQSVGSSLLLGALIGLIALIRPTDIMIGLVFLFWPMGEKFDLKQKFMFLLSKWKTLLLMFLAAFLIWLPQMLFWKYRTGHLLYFSYPGERFFWTDPQIINVLFSYRKGLFVYTPLLLVACVGFFFMRDRLKPLRGLLIFISVLNLYIVSCWWDWFFGGSFGARAFVQHFAYLSIPLAAIIAFVFEEWQLPDWNKLARLLATIVFTLGIGLNLFQTYQYVNGIIHFHSMSRATYWLVFGKAKLNEQQQAEFWGTLYLPDYDKLRSGENRDQ